MKVHCIIMIVFSLILNGCSHKKMSTKKNYIDDDSNEENQTVNFDNQPKIQMLNDSLKMVINIDAQIEIIAEGFMWSEGPIWVEEYQMLLFSDVPANIVYQWSEKDGLKQYINPSGYTGDGKIGEHALKEKGANGLLLNMDKKLILPQHGDRRIAMMDADLDNPRSNFITITDNYLGKKFNSPNDIVYHKNGDLYFTDPPYGLTDGYDNSPRKELDFNGVFKVDKNGSVTLLVNDLSRPNGIAFSPNFNKLYVANSDPKKAIWMEYGVDINGNVTTGKIFFDATHLVGEENKGLPDGLKVDDHGNLFATGPGGILIFSSDGNHLGTINTGKATANCGFNADKSILYITADDQLMRLKIKK